MKMVPKKHAHCTGESSNIAEAQVLSALYETIHLYLEMPAEDSIAPT
eukprot:CAMPEP_0181485754 /NCGR_PEP_ID=MMETSP1110-20121109/46746_1 /TAXON_ID=174948 /ORGANISM="Symbiodinium sp., Strain CCMP421" /LENGTH=46 /DNA_ID= /DNA_START= /DNA_END= /DNA_ORIENTATION=